MKNFLEKISTYSSMFSYGQKLRPARDWSMLIIIAAVLTGISVGFNTWLFIEAGTGKLSTIVPTSPDHAIPVVHVSAVQQVFQKRATEEDAYQNQDSFVDPSTAGS